MHCNEKLRLSIVCGIMAVAICSGADNPTGKNTGDQSSVTQKSTDTQKASAAVTTPVNVRMTDEKKVSSSAPVSTAPVQTSTQKSSDTSKAIAVTTVPAKAIATDEKKTPASAPVSTALVQTPQKPSDTLNTKVSAKAFEKTKLAEVKNLSKVPDIQKTPSQADDKK